LTLHHYMLKHDDVLNAIDLKVDYCMSASSLDEHGWNLIAVNHYELCAEHALPKKEWWSFVHCMYGLQTCLNYNTTEASAAAGYTCDSAETGADDDLTLTGSGSDLQEFSTDGCSCSLSGVVDFCATEHTSTTYSELTECAFSNEGHELAVRSKRIAEAVNSGDPLWVKVNNMTISLSANEGNELGTWATTVLTSVCNAISQSTDVLPTTCSNF